MEKILVCVYFVAFSIFIWLALNFVEKHLSIFKKILLLQCIVFTPICATVTFFDMIKNGEFISEENFYGVFFILCLVVVLCELIFYLANKYLYFVYTNISSGNNTSWRYTGYILFSNISILFAGTVTIVLYINNYFCR